MTVRPTFTIAVLAVAALSVAACGGSADSSSEAAAAERPGAVRVGPSEAVALLSEREDLTVIDVRTPAEYAEAHLPGAELIDIYQPSFADQIAQLDRDGSYLLYCRSGNRTSQAAALMQQLGFAEVYDAGGLADLARAGADLER